MAQHKCNRSILLFPLGVRGRIGAARDGGDGKCGSDIGALEAPLGRASSSIRR
jgi:hypothetical protein